MKEILEKDYIWLSISSYIAFVLIIKKVEDELRICVDYRTLNALII